MMKPKPFSCALLTLVGLALLREHGLSSAQTEEELVQIRQQEQQRRVQEQQQRVQEQQQRVQEQQQQQQRQRQQQQQQQQQRQEQQQQQPQEHECYTLKLEEDELVYSQLEAEESNNELLAKAYGIINSKLDGVTSMFFDYTGEGQNRKVGKFTAKATVTRVRPSGEDLTQCYYIPYEIKDTDECRLEEGHPMRHKCHRSTVCINTVGSYECGCAAGYWGEEESGSPSLDKPIKSEDGTCGGENSTESCCGTFGYMKERRAACVEDFKCTNDPCKGNTCDDNTSLCSAGQGYKGYECRCKDGFKKDERGDCVRDVRKFENPCRNNTCPYHCRCSVEGDAYKCEPRHGYKAYIDGETVPSDYYETVAGGKRLDKITRCVDKRTPDFTIRGPNPSVYRQGDSYEELGVTIDDRNDDESERKIGIQYSTPPGAYLKKTGEFTVRYVLENRLLEGDGTISKIRKVEVLDVDECTYTGRHAEFRHACSPEAECHNTDGGYECLCAEGYAGDGLTTGQGCVDVTPPTITCRGPGCQTANFRACNSVGMMSEDGSKKTLEAALDDTAIENNIKLLKGDLCGHGDAAARGAAGDDDFEGEGDASDSMEWKPEVCFTATDVEYGGRVVDLTANITRGALEKIPGRERMWRVPHNVKDASGNSAKVFYYNIAVEEVDVLESLQGSAEILQQEMSELFFMRIAVAALLVLLLFPLVWRVLMFVRVVLAAAKVVFFPYSMISSREDFKLGAIDRERKIATYWARLIDEADAYDENGGGHDTD